MTDYSSCTGNWGAGAIGFVLGAALTGNGSLFGNNNCKNNCGEDCKISAIDAKVTDLESWNQSREILGTVTAQSDEILDTLNQINRDNYALGVQAIYNQQTVARNIDKEFCNTNGIIVADGEKTRDAIAAFKELYQSDRYNDLARENAELKNKINVMPLECGLAAINAKFDAIACPAAVRTCGGQCGGCVNPYTLPPLTGTATYTKTYNPNVPTATA